MKLVRFARSHSVGLVALFIVLGGTAWALGRNTVGTKQLRRNAVTTAKIKNGAVTPAKLSQAARSGTRGPTGATGPTGSRGPGAAALRFLADEDPGPPATQLGSAGGFVFSADCTGTQNTPSGVDLRLFAQAPDNNARAHRQLQFAFGTGGSATVVDDSTIDSGSPSVIASITDAAGGTFSRLFLTAVLSIPTGPMVSVTAALDVEESAGTGSCRVEGTAVPTG